MSSQLVHPSELREIDRFYDQLPNKSVFVDEVQTPSRRDKLHVAVAHLVAYWPTTEEVTTLRTTIRDSGRFTQADRMVVDNLESVRVQEVIGDFDPANSDLAAAAELFNRLNLKRPWGQDFYRRYEGLAGIDEIMSKVFAIAVL
jgi:hypothetical protein